MDRAGSSTPPPAMQSSQSADRENSPPRASIDRQRRALSFDNPPPELLFSLPSDRPRRAMTFDHPRAEFLSSMPPYTSNYRPGAPLTFNNPPPELFYPLPEPCRTPVRSTSDEPMQPYTSNYRPGEPLTFNNPPPELFYSLPEPYRMPVRSTSTERPPTPPPLGINTEHNITPVEPTLPEAVQPRGSPIALEAVQPRRRPRQRFLDFFGYGDDPAVKPRKDLVRLVWSFTLNGVQIAFIIALLIYGSIHRTPAGQGMTEWNACSKPLGTWDTLWAIKLAFDCVVAHWSFGRERASRTPVAPGDIEASPRNDVHSPRITNLRSQTRNHGTSLYATAPTNNTARVSATLPYSNLYARLTIVLSFLSFVWFVAANALIYSSIYSCRLTSPHIWWLTFGLLCITYITILELFVLGLLVFIIGPIFYLLWNVFLICIGRHPLQNPHYINPEIGKLSKSVVDRIPLVLYIPAPPEDDSANKDPIAKPDAAHLYPPKPPASTPPRRRFAWFKRNISKKGKDGEAKNASAEEKHKGQSWEDNWEQGEHPFVTLEGNRAVCAICLMDFEEPKRVTSENEETQKKVDEIAPVVQKEAQKQDEGSENEVTEEERLKLEDAGEGPQPLRLLACGHVFHQTCLDPWLTGVSGRCPVCQRPVELQEPEQKKQTRSRGL